MQKKKKKKLVETLENKLVTELEKINVQILKLKQEDPFSDPDHASDNAAIDTDVREQVGHQTIEAQIKDLQRRANDINIALNKVKRGNYGKCERCGIFIPVARLKLIPEARYCIDCEKKLHI